MAKLLKIRSFKNKTITREYETVAAMLHLYCRNQHGTHRDLCKSCRNLLAYVGERLAQCPFSENKWPCSNCRVHCYREPQRSQIRDVMRYSGPRMLWIHPVMAIRHLVKLLHYRR